jgi:hypothetical protein
MFHRLHELARCLPERTAWERLANEIDTEQNQSDGTL